MGSAVSHRRILRTLADDAPGDDHDAVDYMVGAVRYPPPSPPPPPETRLAMTIWYGTARTTGDIWAGLRRWRCGSTSSSRELVTGRLAPPLEDLPLPFFRRTLRGSAGGDGGRSAGGEGGVCREVHRLAPWRRQGGPLERAAGLWDADGVELEPHGVQRGRLRVW
ncbi:hypothetical protein OsI_15090 [Oryza sativa Indica Group]|uniref:Uncharacterized protein n=1 Tax=Oryza sativa subsp. indica TaxID=39946 RepID=B8ARM2_ORYSI|nr:hypothetical protein OsI_15090 [Oryza sativa Indica Group]